VVRGVERVSARGGAVDTLLSLLGFNSGSILGLLGSVDGGLLSLLGLDSGSILGLLGSVDGGLLSLLGLDSGGVLDVGGGNGGPALRLADSLLSLVGVLVDVVLGGGSGLVSLLSSNLLNLLGLLVDDGRNLADLLIDDLLVGLVDEWGEEQDGGANQRKTPEWDNLDEVVGDESRDERLCNISIQISAFTTK
jgi:hypothetical protein